MTATLWGEDVSISLEQSEQVQKAETERVRQLSCLKALGFLLRRPS